MNAYLDEIRYFWAQALGITGPQFLIGRDEQCQLRPASQAISKLHCGVLVRDGKIYVKDFGSTNGTTVDKVLLQDADLAGVEAVEAANDVDGIVGGCGDFGHEGRITPIVDLVNYQPYVIVVAAKPVRATLREAPLRCRRRGCLLSRRLLDLGYSVESAICRKVSRPFSAGLKMTSLLKV